ncbi:AMP-binding protein [Lentzea sp. NPDC059081]|uniref:AMP-binding protein n=1 Tax=Lentzea sp. NPDC059081 TaxID=3346719 RepID=UPI003684D085
MPVETTAPTGATSLWGEPTEPACLAARIPAVAANHPDRVAVIDGDRVLTYRELLAWAARTAEVLRAHGLRRGDLVAIACPRGADAVAALLAVTLSGCAYVPLDLEYPRLRLEHMLRDSAARLVLHVGETFELDTTATAVRIPEPTGDHAAEPVPPWINTCDPGLPVYVIYTSGSTGWPKGVVLQHSCLDSVAHWQSVFSPEPDLRTAQFAPLNFDVSFQEIFGGLYGGATLVIMPERLRRDPTALLAWLAEHRVERLFLPYVALKMIAVAASFGAPLDELALVEVNVAGEQLVCSDDIRALFTALPRCRLVNHYGQSESAMVTAHVLEGPPDRWPTLPPIGAPLPGCELLVDVEDGEDAGELLVAGRPVALGYLNRPELNARRYTAIAPTGHGHTKVFRTGDLVRLRDGRVHFLTRIDDDVKLRGIRINLAEVDAQLIALPGIASAVTVVVEGAGGTRVLRAAVVLVDGVALDEEHTIRRLREALPEVSTPVSITALPSMPTTPSGKLDREAVTASLKDAFA